MNIKRTFFLFLGLLLLESGLAMGQSCPPGPERGVCAAKNGILVIVVDNENFVSSCFCPDLGSPGTRINRHEDDPPNQVVQPTGNSVPLGSVQKWKDPAGTDPDPCIEWNIGGTLNYYCWNE